MGTGTSVVAGNDSVSHVEIAFYAKKADAFSDVVKYVFSSKHTMAEREEGIRYIIQEIAARGIRTESNNTQSIDVRFYGDYTGWLRPAMQRVASEFATIPKGTLGPLVLNITSVPPLTNATQEAMLMLIRGIPACMKDNPSLTINFNS